MSASPPVKKSDVEPGAQSQDEADTPMDREAQETQGQGTGYEFEVKEQDRWLPIANVFRRGSSRRSTSADHVVSDANIRNFAPVARIMKSALPENAKIAKEAKECMQECVSEFISFITSEASEKCQQEKRKTVNGEDILYAMTSLGFENYSEALKIYLARYRETLLANQNKPATGPFPPGSAPGPGDHDAAAAGPDAPYGGQPAAAILGGDLGSPEEQATAFGYTVAHNGTGAEGF
ncbi:hypothetical protein P152DRAFT_468282 [Eremomyces bilateralis CBS 781.70]|uniref:Transcription factor CBF/NF-Y/archaeal histone domain-containing protein n=1 Tax=Eremomyces bilateralis CBS 781.70 TaxID=1392243 RepID=A0A6G1FV68_9PEZI|nr:uncharacterized protein P152DRAFT_468282 [Eremomyces bilateralis CBS 781.70]KAF1809630.1 hypothetical protein P152DRAFT_468282 [Eremomyces bilateralis CBS 781.70]